MISSFYNTFFYEPLYNGLVFLLHVLPWHSLGIALIIFTIFIKIVLLPLSQKSVKTQIAMRDLEGPMNDIKAKYKNNRQEQAQKIMELYKEKQVNPLSGIFLLFIQLPVFFALYHIFLHGGFPEINQGVLYHFVSIPETINMNFLGTNMAEKSIIISFFAGVGQFIQTKLIAPKLPVKKREEGKAPDFKDELARSMQMQMKYGLPLVIFVSSALFLPAAAPLYLVVSSLFAIGQELYMRKKLATK